MPSLANSAAADVHLENISHPYADAMVVDSISLSIAAGELVALLGPSGCGKTTLLRIVAGLLRQSDGTVRIGGDAVDRLAPNEGSAGSVVQKYGLFPPLTRRADRSSRWPWPELSRCARAYCCWMNPLRRSTRTCGWTCSWKSNASSENSASPPSWSPTIRKKRCRWRTGSR